MKRKLFTIGVAVFMALGVANISVAHHNDDHDENEHGLCTAYFSGSENGQGNKRNNGNAFAELVEGITDQDGDGDVDAYDVAQYCLDSTGGFGNPGGGNEPWFGDSNCGYEGQDSDGDGVDDRCEALENYPGGTGGDGNNNNTKNEDKKGGGDDEG